MLLFRNGHALARWLLVMDSGSEDEEVSCVRERICCTSGIVSRLGAVECSPGS